MERGMHGSLRPSPSYFVSPMYSRIILNNTLLLETCNVQPIRNNKLPTITSFYVYKSLFELATSTATLPNQT